MLNIHQKYYSMFSFFPILTKKVGDRGRIYARIMLRSSVVMDIAIFFFSSSGNTWRIAKQVSDSFNQEGAQSNIYNIEIISADELSEVLHTADILGFGYPIFGSDIPLVMKEFMQNLPALEMPKPVFIFCTQLMFSGRWKLSSSRISSPII